MVFIGNSVRSGKEGTAWPVWSGSLRAESLGFARYLPPYFTGAETDHRVKK